jgi:hypothetical protein
VSPSPRAVYHKALLFGQAELVVFFTKANFFREVGEKLPYIRRDFSID